MPRVKIGPALPDRATLDVEIARLRDLDVTELRSHWQVVFGRPTLLVICYFGPWLTGCRLIVWATWRLRLSVCSTARGRLTRLDRTPCG